jgi:dihydropyrimidinase
MSPPFRNKQHQDSLWAGLQSGSLQVVATDHCAFTTSRSAWARQLRQDPERHRRLEDRMPVLWTKGVNTGRLTMNEFVAVTSTNIAKILNMYPQEGRGPGGRRRRPRVWDPKRKKTITAAKQQSAIDYNVFEGIEVTGLPRFTLTRGEVAITEDKVRPSRATASSSRASRTARQPRALDLEGITASRNRARARWASAPAFRYQPRPHLQDQ